MAKKTMSSKLARKINEGNTTVKKLIYGGLQFDQYGSGKTKQVWFEIKSLTEPLHGPIFFKTGGVTVPVGMICTVETDGTSYWFGRLQRIGMIDAEGYDHIPDDMLGEDEDGTKLGVDSWLEWRRALDISARQDRSITIAQNKLERELGEKWQDMSVKDVCTFVAYQSGAKKVNMLAVVLRQMGL